MAVAVDGGGLRDFQAASSPLETERPTSPRSPRRPASATAWTASSRTRRAPFTSPPSAELFEEGGILLARNRLRQRGGRAARRDRCAGLAGGRTLAAGRSFVEILAANGGASPSTGLVLFAHWVTPDIEPRRFDAYFFLAVEPEAQDASHCGRETTAGIWMRPGEALTRCRHGEIALPPPTWTTLRQLETVSARWTPRWRGPARVRCRASSRSRSSRARRRIVTLPGDPSYPAVPKASRRRRHDLRSRAAAGGRWTGGRGGGGRAGRS